MSDNLKSKIKKTVFQLTLLGAGALVALLSACDDKEPKKPIPVVDSNYGKQDAGSSRHYLAGGIGYNLDKGHYQR